MHVDTIDYKQEQYAELSDAQILEIRDAQRKKNDRVAKMYEELRKLRQKAVDNGTLYSRAYDLEKVEVQEDCDSDILRIKEDLIFYLQYASRHENTETNGYPLDYSLSVEERFVVVRDYYLDAYSDPKERLAEFEKDKIARTFLCETYAAMLDYLWSLANL